MANNVANNKYSNAALDETKDTVTVGETYLANIVVSNRDTAEVSIQLFDKLAANVTVGTTVPDWIVTVPASSVSNILMTLPILFGTGIVAACATTPTGNSAPGTAAVVNLAFT